MLPLRSRRAQLKTNPNSNKPKQPQVCIKNFGIAGNSSFQGFRQKYQNFGWFGEPPIINIFQKYFTRVFKVNGVFWKGNP